MKKSLSLLATAATLCLAVQAHATTLGDTFDVSIYDGPSNQNPAFSLGQIVVPGTLDSFGFTTTFSGNTITIAEDPGNSTTCNTFNPGDVCGIIFSDLTKSPFFSGISMDPSSTTNKLTPSFDSNHIYLDFTNLTLDAGDVATFDLTYADDVVPPAVTPEPSSLVLLGTGALGLAGAMRRRISKR